MTTEKMNVHRALSELKVLDDRISDAINRTHFCTAAKHSATKLDGMSLSDYKENTKSNYQKTMDLIRRRDALKRAVVNFKAETKVYVAGETMTVAEAIDKKNYGVSYLKSVLRRMSVDYENAIRAIAQNSGDALEKRAEQFILSMISAQPKDAKMSIDDDSMQKTREEYIKNNTYDLIDPIGIVKAMDDLRETISDFESEVDAVLSTSNAVTEIEISY